MKNPKIYFALLVVSCLASCSKDNTTAPPSETTDKSADVIQCVDNTLYFPSAEVCLNTMMSLADGDALMKFETEYKFHSLRSYVDVIYDELASCESQLDYELTLESNQDYIEISGDRPMRRVVSVGYASIANPEGIFYVGEVKHTVTPDGLIVETIDPKTRAVQTETIDYIVPCVSSDKTRGEITWMYTDRGYTQDRLRVFARTYIMRNAVAQTLPNGNIIYITNYVCQIACNAQELRSGDDWRNYKEILTIERIHFDVTIADVRISYGQYNSTIGGTFTSPPRHDFAIMIPVGEGAFIGYPEAPMPAKFNCIVHRVRGYKIGDCGVVTDERARDHTPVINMPKCI